MRPIIWICIAVFAAAMALVSFGAHQIVGAFGVFGGVVTIAAMYGAARYYERRQREREIKRQLTMVQPFVWPPQKPPKYWKI